MISMLKTFALLFFSFLLIWGCQSGEEKLSSALQAKLIKYIQDEHVQNNGSARIDTCLILRVDTLNTHELDSVLIAVIRERREYYDSMADVFLKNGNVYNHEAFAFQKSGDIAKFNLAILNATDSHYQAGNFIDSSMAIQKTAEYLRNKTTVDSDTAQYFQTKVFLKATVFMPADSTNLHDTVYYHFTRSGEVIDVNKELEKMVKYEF